MLTAIHTAAQRPASAPTTPSLSERIRSAPDDKREALALQLASRADGAGLREIVRALVKPAPGARSRPSDLTTVGMVLDLVAARNLAEARKLGTDAWAAGAQAAAKPGELSPEVRQAAKHLISEGNTSWVAPKKPRVRAKSPAKPTPKVAPKPTVFPDGPVCGPLPPRR